MSVCQICEKNSGFRILNRFLMCVFCYYNNIHLESTTGKWIKAEIIDFEKKPLVSKTYADFLVRTNQTAVIGHLA